METQTGKKATVKATKPKSVDDYLEAAPKDQRAALLKLRETIKKAAPKATEGLSYGLVGFKHNGKPLVHFAYWKDHFAIYGSFDAHAAELKDYDQSHKGTIRFPRDEPLPYRLVAKMVKTRIAEIEKAAEATPEEILGGALALHR
ncbi:iron chaperone [soil metagenome]